MQTRRIPLLLLILLSSVTRSSLWPIHRPRSQPENSYHFVLVHGAFHGAWSWYKVSTFLTSSGHKVTAIDMAACGLDRRQAKSISSVSEYFQPLMELMASLASDERVVLVGHSMGGYGVAKAMEDFSEKISIAVFVAAAMPGTSLSVSTIALQEQRGPPTDDVHFVYEDGPDKPPTALVIEPLKLASHYYQLSPPEDWTLATTLVRPHGVLGKNSSEEFVFTSVRYGSVKRAFVMTDQDFVVTKKFQLWMIENNPPNIVVEIRGSDHMVMASKPLELAHQLLLIVNQSFLVDA